MNGAYISGHVGIPVMQRLLYEHVYTDPPTRNSYLGVRNLGQPEILIWAPSSDNLEHRLLYRI